MRDFDTHGAVRCPSALLTAISVGLPLACYRDLRQIECDGLEPPSACTSSTSGVATSDADAASSSSGDLSSSGHRPDPSDTSSADTTSTGTSGAADTTDTGTSTDAAPICGDGVLDPTHDEECDDANRVADDGCNLLCKRDRTVFLASAPGFIAGMLQGLQGADNYCVSRAGLAGLDQPLKFKAFLSDSKTDAVDRLFAGEGRYVLLDGTVVADDWEALLSEPLQHPIELTELGEVAHVGVWTGTRYGDGRAVPGLTHCDDWTSSDGIQGSFGWSDEVDANWTHSEIVNPTSCISSYAIYCIEQQ